jgi:hypothetical protein
LSVSIPEVAMSDSETLAEFESFRQDLQKICTVIDMMNHMAIQLEVRIDAIERRMEQPTIIIAK